MTTITTHTGFITKTAYDAVTATLEVLFKTSKEPTVYFNVPANIGNGFATTGQPGQFFRRHVKMSTHKIVHRTFLWNGTTRPSFTHIAALGVPLDPPGCLEHSDAAG